MRLEAEQKAMKQRCVVAYDPNKSKNCLVDLDRSINCLVARLDVKRKHWAGGVNLGKKSRAPKVGMLRAQDP